MTPVDECETVSQDMTIREAVRSFERAQDTQHSYGGGVSRYNALLVLDRNNRVVGKLGHTDIVAKVDASHGDQAASEAIAHTSTAGLSPALLLSLSQRYSLWKESFDQRCRHLLALEVKECMATFRVDDGVLESDPLDVAVQKLATGNHQCVLVIRDDEVVGILGTADVIEQIARGCVDGNE